MINSILKELRMRWFVDPMLVRPRHGSVGNWGSEGLDSPMRQLTPDSPVANRLACGKEEFLAPWPLRREL